MILRVVGSAYHSTPRNDAGSTRFGAGVGVGAAVGVGVDDGRAVGVEDGVGLTVVGDGVAVTAGEGESEGCPAVVDVAAGRLAGEEPPMMRSAIVTAPTSTTPSATAMADRR
jgi:hypothetical protein